MYRNSVKLCNATCVMRSYSMPLYEQLHIVFIRKISDDALLEIGHCLVYSKACWESVFYCYCLVYNKACWEYVFYCYCFDICKRNLLEYM